MYTKRLLDRLRLKWGGRERLHIKSTDERKVLPTITECCAYICSGRVFTMPILIDHAESGLSSPNRQISANESKIGGGARGQTYSHKRAPLAMARPTSGCTLLFNSSVCWVRLTLNTCTRSNSRRRNNCWINQKEKMDFLSNYITIFKKTLVCCNFFFFLFKENKLKYV